MGLFDSRKGGGHLGLQMCVRELESFSFSWFLISSHSMCSTPASFQFWEHNILLFLGSLLTIPSTWNLLPTHSHLLLMLFLSLWVLIASQEQFPFLVTVLGNTLETTFPNLSCSMICSYDQLLANEIEMECSIRYSSLSKWRCSPLIFNVLALSCCLWCRFGGWCSSNHFGLWGNLENESHMLRNVKQNIFWFLQKEGSWTPDNWWNYRISPVFILASHGIREKETVLLSY